MFFINHLLKFKYQCGQLKINGTCYSYSAGLHGCMADKQVERRTSTFTTQGPKVNSTENRLTSRRLILCMKFLTENITLGVIHMHIAFKSLKLILLNMNPSIIPYSRNIPLHNCGAILLYSRAFTNMPDIWESWSSFGFAVSYSSNTRQVWIQSTWIFYPKNPQGAFIQEMWCNHPPFCHKPSDCKIKGTKTWGHFWLPFSFQHLLVASRWRLTISLHF